MGAALNEKFKGRAKEFVNAGIQEGVMLHVAGPDVVRLLPSLVISDEDLNEGLARIEKTFAKVLG